MFEARTEVELQNIHGHCKDMGSLLLFFVWFVVSTRAAVQSAYYETMAGLLLSLFYLCLVCSVVAFRVYLRNVQQALCTRDVQ